MSVVTMNWRRKYVCGYNGLERKEICLWLQWIGEEGNMFVVTMNWRE